MTQELIANFGQFGVAPDGRLALPALFGWSSTACLAADGGWHAPLQDVAHHLKNLPRDRHMTLHCNCPSEAPAARAELLMNHGFKRVRPLPGRLDARVAAGYAAEMP